MAARIHDNHSVRLVTQSVGQAAFFRSVAFAPRGPDPRSQTSFRHDALEPAREMLTCIMKRLEDGAKEREYFVVARLAAPSETFVHRFKLLGC